MKTISADPDAVIELSDSNSEINSELNSEFNSELEFSELDRSVEVVESPVPLGPDEGSTKTKRYPSFRDIFLHSLRGRKLSSSADDARPKRKDKSAGCAGWLRKTSAADLSESSECDDCPELIQISSSPIPAELQCSRCQQVFDIMPSGTTYTKRQAPDEYIDDNWLCTHCLRVLKDYRLSVEEGEATDECDGPYPLHRGPHSLAFLAMDVLKMNPQLFTLTNLSCLRKREDLGENGVEDMITISDLNEASLLWNLKSRYENQLIYTYIGNILVSVNPYQMFDIYGLDMVKKYENQILGTLSPHIFAIGSAAYERLTSRDGEPQVVIISGESGSGKTEATKLIMQYLAAVNKATPPASSLVTEQILEASPLLESFGNATTVRNDNSSRFGKYTQIFFRNGVIAGAKITEYLLEKSRIVTHAAEERNYHVFYEILQGLRSEEKERYGLTSAENYFYLNQGGHCDSSTKNDAEDFKTLLSAMQILGFTADEQDTILRILSSVLHLGNIFFHRKPLKHGQEGVEMGSDAEIRWVSHLLQLRTDGIVNALTTKTTEARNERLHTPLNIDQALDARDAIAKALYSSLFGWLVNRVNSIINKGERALSINILDIFGFEDFPENSLEQLCINYANENLQFYFNKHIFKLEQQEYAKERIEWQNITFTDNQPVISLIAKKPIGLLHLLDDESNFPKATDASFLEKCHYNHALNELYFRPRMSSMEFGIKHYAGQVLYNVDGFLDKNRDTLRPDVVDLLISSRISMISRMFQDMKKAHESSKLVSKGDGRFVTMKPRTPTVAARFHDSLQALLESMSKCNPWFVRCVKPNQDKSPMRFDMPVVLEQLRCTGMLETIRIRKLGYPVRMKFVQFVERYWCLLTRKERRGLARNLPPSDVCKMLLERQSYDQFQLGITKIFIREILEQQLERKRLEKLRGAAIKIQRYVRTYLQRREFVVQRRSAIVIQSWVRRFLARKRYTTLRRGIVRAQAHFRATRQRRLYKELRMELERRAETEEALRKKQRLRAALEEQERVAKATAGFNHLEIPAELAFIYSKLEDWQPMHTERNVVKVVGAVPSTEKDRKLPSDLDHHAFTKFTNIYFKNHLWGAKKEAINTPLLPKSNEADVQESLALFKLILRFMNERQQSSLKREMALSNYIVHKGIVNEQLRDEIFCQICNQTWKNEDEIAVGRGWMLMANCLSAFPPSPVLYKYLLKYVSDHGYNGYKTVCQQKLMQACSLNPPLARVYPPTVMEWKCNRKCVNMALEARYPDDESRHAGIDSWSTAESIASLLVRARGLESTESDGWTLTLSNSDELYDLNGQDFALDVISELETPPAFPVCKSQFLSSRADEYIHGRRTSKPVPPTRHTRNSGVVENEQDRSKTSKSRSLDNLLGNSDQEPELTSKMGLSRSRLNERYRSMDKLKTNTHIQSFVRRSESHRHSVNPRPATAGGEAEWNKLGLSSSALNSRYFSQQNLRVVALRGSDSDSSEPSEKPRRKKSSSSKASGQNLPKRRGNSSRAMNTDSDAAGTADNSDFDYLDSPGKEDYYNGRNGAHRFIKAPLPGKKVKGGVHSSRAYIETRYTEQSVKSSALSDTSETISLTSHVRRVRVPSQSSDVDQYLDDLFMPVLDGNLDGNMDDLSDARSLAASIKGGGFVDKFMDAAVDQVQFYSDASHLADSIKGGGKATHGLDTPAASSDANYEPVNLSTTSPPPLVHGGPGGAALLAQSPILIPGFYGAINAPGPGGLNLVSSGGDFSPYFGSNVSYSPFSNQSPIPIFQFPGYPAMNTPATAGAQSVDPGNMASFQKNMSRAFIQSAVAQNIQIQQQLMAQNQALQHLLHQSLARVPIEVVASSPSSTSTSPSMHVAPHSHEDVDEQVSRTDSDEMDPWNMDGPSGSRGTEQVPPPVLPNNRRDSGLESSRSSFMRPQSEGPESAPETPLVRKNSRLNANFDPAFFKGAPPPPPPPLPPGPIFGDSSEHCLLDHYGRAKTVRIGKWRWPPAREDGETGNVTGSFLEFKMQKQMKKSQESGPNYEGVEWDSFEMEEDSKSEDDEGKDARRQSPTVAVYKNVEGREQSPVQRRHSDSNNKPAGSIGKLKISSEMRAKLELVTIGQADNVPSTKEANTTGGRGLDNIPKLEDNRRLMLQQQLGGRKWDSVEEVERITRRASSEERSDLIKAVQRPQAERVRRTSEVSSSQARSSQYETAMLHSSPPTTYYSNEPMSIHHPSAQPDHRSSGLRSPDLHSSATTFDDELANQALESIHTKLYGPLNAPFFTYNTVPWTLHVRKELFSPSETLVNPLALHLIFCQVVQDSYNDACLRIGRDDRNRMQQMLENYGIRPDNAVSGHHKITLKRNVVEFAKQWPLYFARLYPVSGGRTHEDVHLLAVSHSGLRLVQREPGQKEALHVLQSFGFSDVSFVSAPRSSTLQIALRVGNQLQFFTSKASLISDLIHRLANEAEKEPEEYVRAVADYVTRESTLLSFRKGDVIHIVHNEQYVDKGWMFGKLDGRVGIFPADYVEPMSRIEARKFSRVEEIVDSDLSGAPVPKTQNDTPTDSLNVVSGSETSHLNDPGSPTQPNDGKHSLLQFALYHFRQSPEKFDMLLNNEDGTLRSVTDSNGKTKKSKGKKSKERETEWTWKEQVDLVKFTKSPIQASLLRLESSELNRLALEGFLAIMKYMGDYPMAKGQSEVDSVYTILMNCHKHESLRDETFCQIMKQTTNNKSSRPDSCQRGWRLFSIIAAYFSCTPVLKPYLFKYLETAAYDKRRAYHGTAMVCLQNLRKTLRYGGRKNVPSIEEITAITAGRNSKRQMYRLPGGTERVINTKSTSVVQDIIEEIGLVINVRSDHEMEEYSLYCIVEGDTFTMPLAREEYILDVTTELQKNQQVYYLIFCRSVWHYPMRLDNPLYIEIVFNQIAPDYLEGLLLVMPGEQISQDCVYDIAKVAALLHRAADLDHMPTMKETKYLLPKPALSVRDIKPPQWVNLVQSSWKEVEYLKPSQAKAQVLEVLEKWSLFGSSFFAIRREADPSERSEHILALNKNGVHFLDVMTHETLLHYPFAEVISTRKVKSEDGILFLDMKCGNLMQQRVTRIQTDQAHEISRLIRQYITIQQRGQNKEEAHVSSR